MTNKKRFLVAMAILACVASLFCAFICSRFAPRSVRHQRESVVADARTLLAIIRYLATPEWPVQRNSTEWGELATNPPQSAQPAKRAVADTNVASLAISNRAPDILSTRAAHG
ncbi:MAG: hypothetical protein ABSH48_02930 [Verrucomicrobiota bacterium]|jgi:hypothetical protein